MHFVFGYDARANLVRRAEGLEDTEFRELMRRAKGAFVEAEQRRARPTNVKATWVREREYKVLRLRSEDIAEFDYQPRACSRPYRMVVVRKNLSVERGDNALFDEVRYFFYLTNDRQLSAEQVVFEANDRCDQENLIEQLKNGARALHAPVNTLLANGAYMVMAALAWSFKTWMALSLPIADRWRERHEEERRRWLRMDFRSFRQSVIDIPAQILRSGRRRIWRLLAWRSQLPALCRLLAT